MLNKLPSFIFRNSKIPELISFFFDVAGVTIGPFIFIRKGYDSERLINHEKIHIVQQYELLFIFQWILYGLFWLIGFIKTRDSKAAYLNNPFEKEAYDNDSNQDYLSSRKFLSWINYI